MSIYFKPLPDVIPQSGDYSLHLELHDGDFRIYSQRVNGEHRSPRLFEVVRPHEKPAEEIFGRQYEAREVYPHVNEWGTRGWTVRSIETGKALIAIKRKHFKELAEKV